MCAILLPDLHDYLPDVMYLLSCETAVSPWPGRIACTEVAASPKHDKRTEVQDKIR